MVKVILKHFILISICIVVSYSLFYFVIDDYIMRFIGSTIFLNIGLRVILAFTVYFSIVSLFNRRVSKIHIDIFAILYFFVIIGLSFFKEFNSYNGINLNAMSILSDFKQYHNQTLFLLIGNIFAYFPLGIYIKYKTSIRTIKLLYFFLPYSILVEISQYIFKCGICDINDIICNTLGFLSGAVVYNLALNYSNRIKRFF